LEFGEFKSSQSGDYVFLHLNDLSRQKLFELHERAFRVVHDIGLEEHSDKKFRHFEYDPHISIIKIEPEKVAEALEQIKNDFRGLKMSVTKYVITRQVDDEKGFSVFPIIKTIELK
jgi:hypothetical protein